MDHPVQAAFPYLRVRNATAAIEFYKTAFGAVEEGSTIEVVSREEMQRRFAAMFESK